jgi:DNA-binding XRE family transcriptional regulator
MGRTTQKAGAEKVRSWLISKRKELGLSQGQMAAAGGISQPSYCDIENGVTKTPKMETSKKLAAFIGEHWTRFYEEDENE